MHRRRAGSGSVFWPACVLGTGASCVGIRNVKWPEVRLSPTPATPLHPPAASKDPQPPFCVFGSQIQQLIQCMWAILKVLSRSPSSVDFHHVAQRLQGGSGAPKEIRAARTLSDTNHMQRLSSPALLLALIQAGCAGLFKRKKTVRQPPVNSLPPAEQRQGSPRLSQTERYTPVWMLNSATH